MCMGNEHVHKLFRKLCFIRRRKFEYIAPPTNYSLMLGFVSAFNRLPTAKCSSDQMNAFFFSFAPLTNYPCNWMHIGPKFCPKHLLCLLVWTKRRRWSLSMFLCSRFTRFVNWMNAAARISLHHWVMCFCSQHWLLFAANQFLCCVAFVFVFVCSACNFVNSKHCDHYYYDYDYDTIWFLSSRLDFP